MPIINFSDKDLRRGKVVEPAWYIVQIDNVGEAPSKDGGSTNYPVEGIIVKNADNGTEDLRMFRSDWNLNSKAMELCAWIPRCPSVLTVESQARA